MITLAEKVLEAHHIRAVGSRKSHKKHISDFWMAATPYIKAEQFDIIARLFEENMKNIADVAIPLAKALKFQIDEHVADAIVKMIKTPTEVLVGALKFARPPFKTMWIEYSLPDNSSKNGWLIEEDKSGLIIKRVASTVRMNHTPAFIREASTYKIDENGFHMVHTNNMSQNKELEEMKSNSCREALSILLLLNSRSNILKLSDPEENFDTLNKTRRRTNKHEKPALGTIHFDIARILGKNSNTSQKEAERIMSTALVRGHFKIRKTGVFFWSPYVRNAANEDEKTAAWDAGAERIRRITRSGTHELPAFTPK